MNRNTSRRSLAALLALMLLAGLLAGCTTKGGQPQKDTPAQPEVTATEETSAPTEPEDETLCGASWRQVFGDKTLPEDGWLRPDEVGFYRTGEDGTATVIVMTVEEMHAQLSQLGNLPRTRYFENMLDERFGLLFSTYDMALELGCRKFALPTTLRARDASDAAEYIDATFLLYGSEPNYTVTKDLTDRDGASYRFLTVNFATYTQEMVEQHHEGVEEARRQLGAMDQSLDKATVAMLIYLSVATMDCDLSLQWNTGERITLGWSTLYEAIVHRVAPQQGFTIALYTLFNLAGIDCLYVSGSAVLDQSGALFYTWNIAKIEDNYYVFDTFVDNMRTAEPEFQGVWQLGLCFGMSDQFADLTYDRVPGKFFADKLPTCPKQFDFSQHTGVFPGI